MNKYDGLNFFVNADGVIKVKINETIETKEPESDDFTLIKFHSNTENKTHNLTASEATKNILITGETGSGKTTSTVLPIIESLINNNCPGLVLDIKSDLYLSIHALANEDNADRLVFLGLDDFCHPINILSSVESIDQFRNILLSLKPFGGVTENTYWFKTGVEDIIDIVKIHTFLCEQENNYYNFDIELIYKYVVNSDFTRSIVDKAYSYILNAKSVEILRVFDRVKSNPFSLYYSNQDEAESMQQKEWRSGQIASVIGKFCNSKYKEKLFNNNFNTTLKELIYYQDCVIVFCMPLEEESNGFYIAKMLRELYFKAVTSYKIKELSEFGIGVQHNRYTFLAIDEYQFYVNTDGSNGVITDEKWLSISRGFANINVFATQSLSSIVSEIGEEKTRTIVQNFANNIFLKTNDPYTFAHANFLTNPVISQNIVTPKSGKRLGVYKVSSNGGSKIDCFDISKNEVSNKINSQEFKDLKKISDTTLYDLGCMFDNSHNNDEELELELELLRNKQLTESSVQFDFENENDDTEYKSAVSGNLSQLPEAVAICREVLFGNIDSIDPNEATTIEALFNELILSINKALANQYSNQMGEKNISREAARVKPEELSSNSENANHYENKEEQTTNIDNFEFAQDDISEEDATPKKPFYHRWFRFFGVG